MKNIYNKLVEWAIKLYWFDSDSGNLQLAGWIEKEYLRKDKA